MPKLYDALPGFHDELEKIAGLSDFVSKNQGMLGSAGALLGHGAAAGAVLGGLHGAYKNYREAKDQGAGTGLASVHAVGGALGGIPRGALGGALIGGGAGAALHTLRPQAAEMARKALSSPESRLGALGRFGQRQVHGLTGWTPPEGLSADTVRGGSWATRRAADAAAGTAGFDKAFAAHELQKKVESKGLTHLPGIASALRGPERGEAAKALFRHATTDNLSKMLMAGSALSAADTLLDKRENPNKGEQLGQSVGGFVGSVAGSALPFGAGMIASSAAGAAGKRVGRVADWLRNRGASHADHSEVATNEGQHIPSESYTNPAVTAGAQ